MMRASTKTGIMPSWNHDGRRTERLDVRMKASLRESGCTKFNVEVLDMSVSGFRFETAYSIAPSSRVWLTIPGLAAREAIVAWQDRYRYGCYFVDPLHIAVFDHIVVQYRQLTRFA
ncbi:MAG: PilZ domain-containing protein [Pseudomonadota bacterium]